MTLKQGDPIRFAWDDENPDHGMDLDDHVIRGVLVTFPTVPGCEFRLDVTPDRVTRLDVRSPDGVTSRSLREVPLGTIARDVRGWASNQVAMSAGWEAGVTMDVDLASEVIDVARSFKQRPGRGRRGDDYYARAARDYVNIVSTSTTPLKDLADLNGYSTSQVRNILGEARRRELLTEAPPGRAGGVLTPKAWAILRETGD